MYWMAVTQLNGAGVVFTVEKVTSPDGDGCDWRASRQDALTLTSRRFPTPIKALTWCENRCFRDSIQTFANPEIQPKVWPTDLVWDAMESPPAKSQLLTIIANLRTLSYEAVGLLKQGMESGQIEHLPEPRAWYQDLSTKEYGAGLPSPDEKG